MQVLLALTLFLSALLVASPARALGLEGIEGACNVDALSLPPGTLEEEAVSLPSAPATQEVAAQGPQTRAPSRPLSPRPLPLCVTPDDPRCHVSLPPTGQDPPHASQLVQDAAAVLPSFSWPARPAPWSQLSFGLAQPQARGPAGASVLPWRPPC